MVTGVDPDYIPDPGYGLWSAHAAVDRTAIGGRCALCPVAW